MRIGLVCPYSFDVPGGVQFHVRDLAEWLGRHGHAAQVLAPADDDAELPDYFTSCGRAIPVRYNGSVARLTFGPVTAARVNRWLAEGEFDVVHLHEPMTPSASVLAPVAMLDAAPPPSGYVFRNDMQNAKVVCLQVKLFRRNQIAAINDDGLAELFAGGQR